MPEPNEKKFEDIQKERDNKEKMSRGMVESMHQDAEYNRYEQNRIQGKQGLKNMLAYYRGLEKGDEKLAAIMDKLDRLASLNSTSDNGYWQESDAFMNALEEMDEYVSQLADLEERLHDHSKDVFYRAYNGDEGHWLTEQEIEDSGSEELQSLNEELNRQQNIIDDKLRLVSDLKHYLEAQTTGRLIMEEIEPAAAEPDTQLTQQDTEKLNEIFSPYVYASEANIIRSVPNQVTVIGTDPKTLPATRHIVYTNKQMDLRFYDGKKWKDRMAVNDRETVNHAQSPLFPHEPCVNDISQGDLGDCYYLSGLVKVVQLNPEKIKEMMKDNGDGTVTVRLYSKNEKGQYAPVYVTVDKVDETISGEYHRNGLNSLWVNCLERALAVSGLHSGSKTHRPVPENISEVYNALKEKQDAGQLTGNHLIKAAEEYPWLFARIQGQPKPQLVPWPSMASIEGGFPSDAIEIILGPGYDSETITMPKNVELNTAYNDEQNKAFEEIFHCVQRDMPITAVTVKESPDIKIGNHAFTVLDAYEHEGVKYVRVRNPWGIANHGYESIVGKDGKVKVKAVNSEQSIYDVEFSAFCRNFPYVFVNGYHRDETSIEIPRPEELRAEKEQAGPAGESQPLELNDSTFIQNPQNLGIYLSQTLDAELYNGNRSENVEEVLKTEFSDYSNPEAWKRKMISAACRVYPEWNEYGNHNLECLREDLPNFRTELQELINESCTEGRSSREILQDLGRRLKDSEQRLVSEGKNPESEKFLKRLVDELKNSTDRLLGQVEKGTFKGEKELNEFFDKMKAIQEDPSFSHDLYFQPKGFGRTFKINRFYRNEQGTCMVALKFGEDEKQMTFREAMQRAQYFRLKDHRIEAGKGTVKPGEPLPPPAEPGREQLSVDMSYESFMQYKKMLNDLDHTLSTEKGWMGKSSPESQALRAALKDVKAFIAGKGSIGYKELQQQLDKLTKPLDDYEAHCAANPRRLTRRQNRLKACGMLRDLQQAARDRNPEPMKECQMSYAMRIAKAVGKLQNKPFTEEEARQVAGSMLTNPQMRGYLVNQDVFHMKHSSDREVGKDMKKMLSTADKSKRRDEPTAAKKLTN